MSIVKSDVIIPLSYGSVVRVDAYNRDQYTRSCYVQLMSPSSGAEENIAYTPAESCKVRLELDQLDKLIDALKAARNVIEPPIAATPGAAP